MQKLLYNIRWPVPAEILLCEVPILIKSTKGTCGVRVLGMGRRRDEGRVRCDEHVKRTCVRPQNGVFNLHRGNPNRKICLPHMRQSKVREPGAFIRWHECREHGRYGEKRTYGMGRKETTSRYYCKDVGVPQVARIEAFAGTDSKFHHCQKKEVEGPRLEKSSLRQESWSAQSQLWKGHGSRTQSVVACFWREHWEKTLRGNKEANAGVCVKEDCSRRSYAARVCKVVRGLTVRRQDEYRECIGPQQESEALT